MAIKLKIFRRSITANIISVLIIAVIAVLFLYPLALAVKTGVIENSRISFYWLGRVLGSEILLRQLCNSFLLAICTTLAAVAISIPTAITATNFRFRGKSVLGTLILLPLILPPFVGGLSIKRLLGQFGVLNILLDKLGIIDISAGLPPDWLGSGFIGVVILQTLHLFPITYLNTCAALANLDPAYVQAGRNLGAGPIRNFFEITLPLIRPGIFAGASIVFIWSFTDIGTAAIVGYDDLAAITIFKEIAKADVSPLTYSLVLILLAASCGFYCAGRIMAGAGEYCGSTRASVAFEPGKFGKAATAAVWLLFGTVIFAAVLPHIGVVVTAVSDKWVRTILPEKYTFRHLAYVFTKAEIRSSLMNSLKYASVSTLIDLIIGSIVAWLIVRSRPVAGRLLDGLVMLPLAVPGIILAAGYVVMTAPGTKFETIGPLRNPFGILVIAYAMRRMPFFVRSISAGLMQLPESLEEAARNLGASKFMTIMRITTPLLLANITAAAVLTFAFAMLEVSDSLVLAQLQQDYPLTKQIYVQATSGNTDALNIASALGVYGMAFLGGAMAIASLMLGKKLGAIFRA